MSTWPAWTFSTHSCLWLVHVLSMKSIVMIMTIFTKHYNHNKIVMSVEVIVALQLLHWKYLGNLPTSELCTGDASQLTLLLVVAIKHNIYVSAAWQTEANCEQRDHDTKAEAAAGSGSVSKPESLRA